MGHTAVVVRDAAALPANPLPPRCQGLLKRVLASAYPLERAGKLAAMAPAQLQPLIEKQLSTLNRTLTRQHCDKVLRGLALTLPRAGMSAADVSDMLDLYFDLLSRYGVSDRMLSEAAERYVMATPSERKRSKFYPDPGELYDLCRDDVRYKQKRFQALTRALRALEDMLAERENVPPPARAVRTAAEIIAEHDAKMAQPKPGDVRALIGGLTKKFQAPV